MGSEMCIRDSAGIANIDISIAMAQTIIANLFAFFIKEPPCKNCKPTHLPNFVHWNHSFLKLTKRSISYSISIACVCIFVNIFCVFLTIFFNIVKNNNAYLS